MKDKLVEGLEVRGEHDKGQEGLQEDGGGEGGKLQLIPVGGEPRQFRAEHKVCQVGEIAAGEKRKGDII